jgi:Iodothyronine deiodinase
MPVLIDGLDDAVARAYGAWPDRLYLIGRDGRIAFQGGEGPFGFKPDELEAAIESEPV